MSAKTEPPRYTVLSHKAILLWAILIVAIGVGLAVWLLLAYGQKDPLGAIRTAGTVVIGSGGGVALLLAARRQRSTEIALQQKDRDQADVALAHALQERVAAENRNDAAERRITELYTKAVEQLGSDKAPVRLGGLYALERLAEDNEHQRQTIVNVLCAYLRMPYQLPDVTPADGTDKLTRDAQLQEREVRLTAQRLLTSHLQSDSPMFWNGIALDLTGAALIDFTMIKGTFHWASFKSATFSGNTIFIEVTFPEYTTFEEALFTGDTNFVKATFRGDARFDNSTFSGDARFGGIMKSEEVTFAKAAKFRGVIFNHRASFSAAIFIGAAYFRADPSGKSTRFAGDADFWGSHFRSSADFTAAMFEAKAEFRSVSFAAKEPSTIPQLGVPTTDFRSAKFAKGAPPEIARFLDSQPGWPQLKDQA